MRFRLPELLVSRDTLSAMTQADDWLGAFLAGYARPLGEDNDRLREILADQIEAALQSWPDLCLSAVELARTIRSKLAEQGDSLAELQKLRVSDLYLATAAANGDPKAVAFFETRILSRVPVYLGKTGANATLVDEATQRLRVKLLVSTPETPARLQQYAGRGALESWVCASAVRVVRDLQRYNNRRIHDETDELEVLAASDNPELELLRARYQSEFRSVLQQSVAKLTPRQRTLLRLQFFEGFTTIEIGRLYRVNQSTASRWLTHAREAVLDGVKRCLRDELAVSSSALDSLIGLLQSRLDVSFQRLLADESLAPSRRS